MQSENKENFSNLSGGEIAGITIGGIVLVILVILSILILAGYETIGSEHFNKSHIFIFIGVSVLISVGIIIGFVFAAKKNNENKENFSNLSTGQIVAITIGSGILILVVIAIILLNKFQLNKYKSPYHRI